MTNLRNGDWELTVVENAGEIPADSVTDSIQVPTKPLLIDIKSQLMMHKPVTLTYTIGWRAIVWQNKETGQFKDLSEADHKEYIKTGSVNSTTGNGKDSDETEPANRDTGSTT
tara:strand:+ start:2437 stop:2775 length:339 start_codon:yes stop_codon:yes gene_type:complete